MNYSHLIQACRRVLLFALWALLGLISSLSLPGWAVLPAVTQAREVPSTVQTLPAVAQQEQEGRKLYETGQFSEAVRVWQQVAGTYQTRGDALNRARVLNNLSFAYQQLGQWERAKEALAESLKLLQAAQISNSKQRLNILAQALNSQGSLQLALGQPEQALATWQQAAVTYTEAGDELGAIRSTVNQGQALKALGLYRRALATLTQVRSSLEEQPDSLLKAAGLDSLGSTLCLIGDLEQSRQVLQQSLMIAQKLNSAPEIAAALFSLGDTARSRQDAKAALEFYQQAAAISPVQITKIKAKLNKLSLLVDTEQWSDAQAMWPQIEPQIANLPPSRAAIDAQINLAHSLTQLKQNTATNTPTWSAIAQLVAKSAQQAKSLGDRRSYALALGILGGVYEQTQQWSSARELTQEALVLAQAINAPDITYRWHWQLGRLLKVQGDIKGAVAAYSQAVSALQSLRSDLVGVNQDIQFSFRESVEPVYRQLVSLLLQPGDTEPSQQNLRQARNVIESLQPNLIQARNVIESLQLAELDNFFREACLDTKPAQIDRVAPQTAVIYPIILADRLEVILSLPQKPLRHYATFISESEVESVAEKFRQALVIRSKREYVPFSQQVYDWLIRPAETDLANSGVKTLVFVLDGSLRNIPVAALNDGKQYLIEKYSIALTPGLQLLDPKQLQRGKLKVLGAGLTEARLGFPPLENVARELKEIKSEVPGVVLLDRDFTSQNLQGKIKSADFDIVHIATHGKFSSKAAETFILTWDDRLSINQLDSLLESRGENRQQPVELLVFSACETAVGDKRAALGIAGMAVRAGARSTLATLWAVNDAATVELMSQFYKELTSTKETKAEVLRRAQLSLLRNPLYKHPIFWAPYVLVGNWL
ncbi:MAG: CHAT domain-containing protein [Oscillatoria princeps RMCB-10]|jgi:CHAT domain-containing protein|nr:CHAT domain-containing protein [Oscillatoria princeps RMCB-10]